MQANKKYNLFVLKQVV